MQCHFKTIIYVFLILLKLFLEVIEEKQNRAVHMSEEKLTKLNLQVESMVKLMEQIKSENNFLRNRLTALVQERADLMDKKNKAMAALKRIVKQLKHFKEYQESEGS